MPRKFRLTCARTTYYDVELAADTSAEAERLLESVLKGDPKLCERKAVGQPIDRIVEIATEEPVAAAVHDAAA